MMITNKINTHFTNLIEDKDFATAYFSLKSDNDYSVERLRELERNVNSAIKKYHFGSQLLSVATFTGAESLIKESALRLEKGCKALSSAENELEIFESNLAYLILSGIIASPDKLGFSSEYVKELLEKKKNELENSTVKYYYDESTGRTSEVINGKYYILSNTPDIVISKVREKQAKKLTDKVKITRTF